MTPFTAETLRALLRYEPETGLLFWKVRDLSIFRGDVRACNSWNAKMSGKEAFTATNNHGYRAGAVFGKTYLAHRMIWLMVHGSLPDLQIDHKNGKRADNRISNLRLASNLENHRNQKLPSTNTSGVIGVFQEKRTGNWVARIGADGQSRHLGTFTDKEDAAAARAAAEIEHNYHKNHGRTAG